MTREQRRELRKVKQEVVTGLLCNQMGDFPNCLHRTSTVTVEVLDPSPGVQLKRGRWDYRSNGNQDHDSEERREGELWLVCKIDFKFLIIKNKKEKKK